MNQIPDFSLIKVYLARICPKNQNLSARIYLLTTFLVLLVLNSGCVQKAQEEAQLEIKNLQPAQSNGVYTVTGKTNLPESSRITVTAVRYLHPADELGGESLNNDNDASTNRSILDRQIVEVKQGEWQTELNLWQVAKDGSFQEVWQANQAPMKLTADGDVTFIATFDPASQWQKSDNKKVEQPTAEYQQLEGKLLRFTNEGEKYVQASQTLSISLPGGKTTPPRSQLEDLNDGWGNRYQIRPQPLTSGVTILPAVKFRQTNAPLSPNEFFR